MSKAIAGINVTSQKNLLARFTRNLKLCHATKVSKKLAL